MRTLLLNKCAAAAAVALLLAAVPARSAVVNLLDWAPVPDAVGFPEIVYSAAGLATGPGALGTADGQFPVGNQLPGGLQVDTPVNAPIAFSFPSSVFTGGTGYYDATLTFTGLAPVGAAQQLNFGTFTQDSQALGPGTFTLLSTALAGPFVLLSGTIGGATIVTGIDGGTAGATFNANGVTYTGGVVLGSANQLGPVVLAGNDMSISLTSVVPNFSVNPGSGQLAPFTADATGQFDLQTVVPEPASVAVLALGTAALGWRRRRR